MYKIVTKRKHMGLPHNTNDALTRIKESNNQANNPIVTGSITRQTSLDRGVNESLKDYNLRVTPGKQPVQPKPGTSYLGKPL